MLWAVYSVGTLVIGISKGIKPLRLFGIVVLLVAIAKLTLMDFAMLGTGARIVGFTVLGILLVASSFLYQRNKEKMKTFFIDSNTPPPSNTTPS